MGWQKSKSGGGRPYAVQFALAGVDHAKQRYRMLVVSPDGAYSEQKFIAVGKKAATMKESHFPRLKEKLNVMSREEMMDEMFTIKEDVCEKENLNFVVGMLGGDSSTGVTVEICNSTSSAAEKSGE